MTERSEYLIWSFEHNAWWAPNRCGYVADAALAGRYDRIEAEKICVQANIAAINEAIVPLPKSRFDAALPAGVERGRR